MTIEYDQLEANAANFVELTPMSFLQRSADIYPQREALIYNERRYTWAQVRNRCTRIASSLAARGIGKNDTVSVFAFAATPVGVSATGNVDAARLPFR